MSTQTPSVTPHASCEKTVSSPAIFAHCQKCGRLTLNVDDEMCCRCRLDYVLMQPIRTGTIRKEKENGNEAA